MKFIQKTPFRIFANKRKRDTPSLLLIVESPLTLRKDGFLRRGNNEANAPDSIIKNRRLFLRSNPPVPAVRLPISDPPEVRPLLLIQLPTRF